MEQYATTPVGGTCSDTAPRRAADASDGPLLSRRRLLRAVGATGVGVGFVWGLTAADGLIDDHTRIVYAKARTRPDGGPLRARTKTVPAEWYRNLTLAFEVQADLLASRPASLLGSYAVPGSYDEPVASIVVDATDESLGETLDELSRGLSIDLNVLGELPPDAGDEPTLAESYQVSDLDERRVPSGYVCATDGAVGTLSPALFDGRSGSRFFATSNHLYGAAGAKATEHAGEPMLLLGGGETRRVGSVAEGYPAADVVRVAPESGYLPVPTIARASPGTVIGQYTRAGLADLMARGERLQKVGAFSNHTTGEIAGVGGVTCYTGEVCKSGQLKWGGEESMVDGDSGSVNFHPDPEHPDQYVLVGGINNARTWWPGADFTWGTAAYRLLAEYGLHF